MKACVIIVYFGKLPSYFDHVIKTMAWNDKIDWLFYGDCFDGIPRLKNFKIFPMDFQEFTALASQAFGEKISLNVPYKTCDTRPMFGKMFEKHIREYEFWAHADTDVIFGDIYSFLEKYRNYDVICPNPVKINGPLTFYRNVDKINHLYRQIGNYKNVLEWEYRGCIDEQAMTYIIKEQENIKKIFKESRFTWGEVVWWSNGKLYEIKSINQILAERTIFHIGSRGEILERFLNIDFDRQVAHVTENRLKSHNLIKYNTEFL
jgi:hypothetical protein